MARQQVDVRWMVAVASIAFVVGTAIGASTGSTWGVGAMARATEGNAAGAPLAHTSQVVSAETAPVRVAPSGKARVRVLSATGAHAFVGLLEMDAGAAVPEHQDADDEFVYILEGGGDIVLDGTSHRVRPGDLVVMPAKSTVSFQAQNAGPTKVLQVFAPSASADKYGAWTPEPK